MRRLRAGWVLVGALAGSCGGGGSEAFINEYCDLYRPCCAMAGLPSDGRQCRALYGAAGGSARYDQAAADKCLAEAKSAGSAEFCSGNTPPSCEGVFDINKNTGTAKPGETCTDDEDCAASSEGDVRCAHLFANGGQVQKCQIVIKGKSGDNPCVGTKDGNVTSYSASATQTDIPPRGYLCDVADGLRCDIKTGQCAVIQQVGGPCSGGFQECVSTAYCDYSMQKCAARKPAGEMCTSSSGQDCVEEAYCDQATKKCTAKLANGVACVSDSTCVSGDCVNGMCAAGSSGNFVLALICGS